MTAEPINMVINLVDIPVDVNISLVLPVFQLICVNVQSLRDGEDAETTKDFNGTELPFYSTMLDL